MPKPDRLALLIGINDYRSAAKGRRLSRKPRTRDTWRNLNGAVNDVFAMQELLTSSYGFDPVRVVVLTDREAGRTAILGAIEACLIAPSGPDAEAVFYFSGHGSRVLNSLSDEPDGMDESIVPWDSSAGALDIRDKELARLFHRVLDRGARLTAIFDSCHSGSAARGLAAKGRSLPASTEDAADPPLPGPTPEERGALVLSAAQDHELAFESFDECGQLRGAFSTALLSALGTGDPSESAEATFLRARARLHTATVRQQPVLAGPPDRLLSPLFGGSKRAGRRRNQVAVQRIGLDGTVLVQGGWIQCLRVGSELRPRHRPGEEARQRLRVTRVLGPFAAEARPLGPGRDAKRVRGTAAGELLEVTNWVVGMEADLEVWIPEVGGQWPAALGFARRLRRLLASTGVRWLEDPFDAPEADALVWEDEEWRLLQAGGEEVSLGHTPDPTSVASRLGRTPGPGCVFVFLPVSTSLADRLRFGKRFAGHSVAPAPDRSRAHYHLACRLAEKEVELSWVRNSAGSVDRRTAEIDLPARGDWHPLGRKSLPILKEEARRLARLRAWLTLEPPADSGFTYRLRIVREPGGEAVDGGVLFGGDEYSFVLQAREEDLESGVTPRYVYVISLDGWGEMRLLFPRGVHGAVENRFPLLTAEGRLPNEIRLGRRSRFTVTQPYGSDVYMLLTTETPIPNPMVIEGSGVRHRSLRGASPLERLLALRGARRRGPESISTPPTWSLQGMSFRTQKAPGPEDRE